MLVQFAGTLLTSLRTQKTRTGLDIGPGFFLNRWFTNNSHN